MTRFVTCVATVCCGFLIACMGGQESVRTENESLVGRWQLIYQQTNGRNVPDEQTAKSAHGQMFISNERIHYTAELQGFDFEFAYVMYPDRQPKAIDLKLTSAPDESNARQELFGIYRVNESNLTICYNKIKRPVNFSAESGSGNVLIVLRK